MYTHTYPMIELLILSRARVSFIMGVNGIICAPTNWSVAKHYQLARPYCRLYTVNVDTKRSQHQRRRLQWQQKLATHPKRLWQAARDCTHAHTYTHPCTHIMAWIKIMNSQKGEACAKTLFKQNKQNNYNWCVYYYWLRRRNALCSF